MLPYGLRERVPPGGRTRELLMLLMQTGSGSTLLWTKGSRRSGVGCLLTLEALCLRLKGLVVALI